MLEDRAMPPRAIGGVSHVVLARSLILLAAFSSFVLSVGLWFTGSEQEAIFVGLWVPSILSLGGLVLAGGDRR